MNAPTSDSLSVLPGHGDVLPVGGSRPLSSEVEIWGARLDDHPSAVLQEMAELLSPDETARAERFRFERDRARYVMGRGILRVLLGRHLGREPRELVFAYGPNGKPALAHAGTSRLDGGFAPVHFNVSHSEGLALFAFTKTGEVGVDLEFVRELPDFDGVAATTFSPVELALWRACPPSWRRTEFFAAWTRQEAVLKAVGTGLGAVASPAVVASFHVYPLNPAPGFAAALAAAPTAEWATLHGWQHSVRSHPSGLPRRSKRMRLADLSAGGAHFL
jgi:4'-phosphopantetheinyl transferase